MIVIRIIDELLCVNIHTEWTADFHADLGVPSEKKVDNFFWDFKLLN